MGPSDYISSAFALVALLVSGCTVFYSHLQVRHAQEQVEQAKLELNFAAHDSATNLMLRLDEIFLGHPLLRPHFYENAPTPTAETNLEMHHRVFAVAEFALDVMECIWERADKYSDADRDSWREWIHDVFASAPAVRSLYSENERWYPVVSALRQSWICTEDPAEHAFFTERASEALVAA